MFIKKTLFVLVLILSEFLLISFVIFYSYFSNLKINESNPNEMKFNNYEEIKNEFGILILFTICILNALLFIFKNPGIIPMQFINPIHLRKYNLIVRTYYSETFLY